ncbi:MAG: AAA family ATPase [Gallionella sp.]|nr:AAA family ATPase [Gallionella sp.]MDD4945752.1 AAA family ATPase [Gallionella sp.]MDD5612478.1 AAA family ATPase [Gallionella sp.]
MRSDVGMLGNQPPAHSRGVDQAEGLRRLLIENRTQVVTLVSGKHGVGRTSATINLAAALAAAGKDVLVLDENPAPHNLTDSLGLVARYDFLDVVQGRCQIRDALLQGKGYAILPTARAMRALGNLNTSEQQCMEHALREVSGGVDVMLVDAAMLTGQSSVSSSLAPGVRLVVVTDATASGITESYGLIKRLALENARLRFEIVVNKVADEKVARLAFGNMEKVARSKLAARLEYLGCIPLDDKQKRATHLARSVVEAYPAASSATSYRALSQELLQMAVRQDEMEGGVSQMMKNLMNQLSRCNSKDMTKAVNSSRAVASY